MDTNLRAVTGKIYMASPATDGRNFYFKNGAEGGELQGQFLDVRHESKDVSFFQTRPRGPSIPQWHHQPNPYFDVQVRELTEAAMDQKTVTLIRERGLFDSYLHQPIVDANTLVLVHD